MAGAGYRDWVAGDVPTATQFDTFLQEQTVMRFATAAARDAALSTVKAEGMVTYQLDSNTVTVYTGAAWVQLGNAITVGWTAYTPTWSGTLGTGSLTGAYRQISDVVHWRIALNWGSSTSHAAATQTLTLPIAVNGIDALTPVGNASAALTGPAFNAMGFCIFTSGTTVFQIARAEVAGAFWTNLVPMTWANGSQLRAGGTYSV